MKIRLFLLCSLFFVRLIYGQEAISIERFKNLTDPHERRMIIDFAPDYQKVALEKIDLHLKLVDGFGGERKLKHAKERYMIKSRGLDGLTTVIEAHRSFGECYVSGVLISNQNAGMPREKLAEVSRKLQQERTAFLNNVSSVDSLVAKLARSPQALALNVKAEKLDVLFGQKMIALGNSSPIPITEKEMAYFDKQINEIFEELKNLPTLTSAKIQEEYALECVPFE